MTSTTTEKTDQRPVLVGVDGSERNLAAVRWAALEAGYQGVPLRMLCVVEGYSVLSPELRSRSVEPAATAALEQAQRVAEEASPGVRVDVEQGSGPPAAVLADESADARLLVVGRRGAGAFRELLLGSTSTSAAAHADTTVVVVPDGWTPDRTGPVVVGLAEDGAGHVLEQALLEASRRGADVRAVHAWDIHPELSWDTSLAYGNLEEFEQEARTRLQRMTGSWVEKYPDVGFDLRVVRAHPTQALTTESGDAGLVVVGAHHGRLLSSRQRLGSVARGVLHHVSEPVMIVRES